MSSWSKRAGGRIFTRRDSATPVPIELGAEFIHGSAPELARVLHEALLSSVDVGGDRWTTMDGRLRHLDDFWERCWEHDPFARGAYRYSRVGRTEAPRTLG